MSPAKGKVVSAMRFLLGFIFGAILGASLALLLTPQPGGEMREKLRQQAQERGLFSQKESA